MLDAFHLGGLGIMTEKRFLLEDSDYDLKYEFSVADLSRVEKTKEDFWNEKEEVYDYFDYIEYLYENNAFLTTEEADKILNELAEENQQLKQLTKPIQDTIIEEFTITKEDISKNQRITELTNYALTEFIKSKGYTLKEVNQFIKEEL